MSVNMIVERLLKPKQITGDIQPLRQGGSQTRENQAWCKERGIRISGSILGRSPANVSKETKKQAWEDERIPNSIEANLGLAKTKIQLESSDGKT